MSDTDREGIGVPDVSQYQASDITVLEGLAPVRKRPGMYIGNVQDGSALHHLLWEVLSNSLDAHAAGKCTTVHLTLGLDGSVTVEDDGPGIPVSRRKGVDRSFLEEVFTTLHTTGTLDGHAPHIHAGLHGAGAAVVNAVSGRMVVETTTGGRRYRLTCERGEQVGPLLDLGPTDRAGTVVSFWPDPAIFTVLDFDHALIADRLRELSALMPALTLTLRDERPRVFSSRQGLADLLEPERHGGRASMEPASMTERVGEIDVSVALLWCERLEQPFVYSFANATRTREDGTHVEGLRRAIGDVSRRRPSTPDAAPSRPRHGGLLAAVSVFLHDPTYANPTKDRLACHEATPAVYQVTRRLIDSSPELRKRLAR